MAMLHSLTWILCAALVVVVQVAPAAEPGPAADSPAEPELEFPQKSSKPYHISNRQDETLNLGELVLSPRTREYGVHLVGLRNCTVKFTIDYDPLPFTQGRVMKVAPLVIKIDEGYPLPTREWTSAMGGNTKVIAFRKGKLLPQQMDWLKDVTTRGNEAAIVTRHGRTASLVRPGDQLVMPDRQFLHAVLVRDCHDCTIECNVWSAPQMAVVEKGGSGNTFRFTTGRKPETDRLLGANADGFNSADATGTKLIESKIEHTGDDPINIHSGMGIVLSSDAKRSVVLSLAEPKLGEAAIYGPRFSGPKLVTIESIGAAENPEQAKDAGRGMGLLGSAAERATSYSIECNEPLEVGHIMHQDHWLPKATIEDVKIDSCFGSLKFKATGEIRKVEMSSCAGGLHIGADAPWLDGPVPKNVKLSDVKLNKCLPERWGPFLEPITLANIVSSDRSGNGSQRVKVIGVEFERVLLNGKKVQPK